jgi:hypothetical protein
MCVLWNHMTFLCTLVMEYTNCSLIILTTELEVKQIFL